MKKFTSLSFILSLQLKNYIQSSKKLKKRKFNFSYYYDNHYSLFEKKYNRVNKKGRINL